MKKSIHKEMPQFVKMISEAAKKKIDVIMMVNAFYEDEADLFFQAMRYASDRGVVIMLAPKNKPNP